jgi:hypothetical protein
LSRDSFRASAPAEDISGRKTMPLNRVSLLTFPPPSQQYAGH